jgi:hypothetical protein
VAEPEAVLRSLLWSLSQNQDQLRTYDQYFEGCQPIRFIAPAMQEEFGDRITALVLNFPRVIVEAAVPRLRIDGFRYAGDSSADQDLWDVWQANDMDEQSSQAHTDSLALSRSYVIVGSGDSADDAPIVTVESPLQVYARRDSRTRRVTSAVKQWYESELEAGPKTQHAVLYLPDSTTHYVQEKGKWAVADRDVHDMGRVPVVPLVNRPRILAPDGLSEFHDILPVADALNKIATDMMVSAEYHAMPRRWGSGVKESDFVDEHGNPLNAWSRDAGTMWAVENEKATFGQFREAELANFHNTIKILVQTIISTAKLPQHYSPFAAGDANPTSADALRVAETQYVMWLEGDKQVNLGGAWEDVNRLILRVMTGTFDPKARSLETVWRNAAAVTSAQQADAALKLATPVQNGLAIVPLEQTRIDLGYTPEQRARMAEMDREMQADPYVAELAAKDAAARQVNPDVPGAAAPAGR